MDLSTRADIEAPIGLVFDELTNFTAFEKAALRRGVEVARLDSRDVAGRGMQWRAVFPFRGRKRAMALKLEDFDRPARLRFDLDAASVTGELLVDLLELSRSTTRLTLKVRLRPLTLSARILVQSMRLAKGRITGRMHDRLHLWALEVSDRHRRGAGRG